MEQQFGQSFGKVMLPPLPNSTAVLVLGILSIATCWCFGIIGLAMGVIALIMSNKASKEYNEHYGQYSESSYKNMQAGKICAIIGVCLSAIILVYYIVYAIFIGVIFSTLPWNNIFNQVV